MQTPVFIGLTRPAMIAGLPFMNWGVVAVVTMLGFIISSNPLFLLVGLPIYGAMKILAAIDPRFLDMIMVASSKTPPTPNSSHWKGKSYSA